MCRGQARGQCPFVMRRRLPARGQARQVTRHAPNIHLPSPIAYAIAPTGQSIRPLTSHTPQMRRAAHCQMCRRWHRRSGRLATPRHCQGLDSIVACVGVCRLVLRQTQLCLHMQHAIVWVSAEMPAHSRLWPWASQVKPS
jgi:hypothetical protein